MKLAGLALVVLFMTLAATGSGGAPGEAPSTLRGLDAYMPVPEHNPLADEKVALGRALFFDPLLSRDNSVHCATCHQPERAFADDRPVSIGVFQRRGTRNVPTLVNRGYGRAHFWDGRSASLEEQVLHPIQDSKEMDLPLEEAVARLAAVPEYRHGFQRAFGRPPSQNDLAFALASYLRSIVSGDSRLDRYQSGEQDALTAQEKHGLRLFRGKANCTSCHLGPLFTDESFHNTGVAWRDGAYTDPGRLTVTGNQKDLGAFKTPTLREVARTAPYMHDGSLATLEDVIDFYDRGGRPNPHLDVEIKPLRLTAEEKRHLRAFLESLGGSVLEGIPPRPAEAAANPRRQDPVPRASR